MKKILYSVLAVTGAITGVMLSKANVNTRRQILIYAYIGPRPTTPTLVTNVLNWTHVVSITFCSSTQAACAFTATIPSLTIGTRHVPSANIGAAIGVTIGGISYYVPIKKVGSAYTYLHAFNQPAW